MSDKNILVCLPLKESPIPPMATATQDTCEHCSEPIWVSPASAKLAVEHNCQVLCTECAFAEAMKQKDFEMIPLSKEQISEVKSALNPERN